MGIFDGVHRGHQAVLGRVVELSHELARDGERPLAVAVTFDPHPRSVHQPEADLPLIASLTDRLASLGDLGLDAVLVITYTLDFAAQSPQDFVRTWLEELLGARAVVVGDDVRFGWRNSGDAATLEQIGRQDGFEVEIVSTIRSDEGRRWSSTWIRQCLKDGNMRQVSRVLGSAKVEVSCLHTRRQWVQAKRRRRTSSCVGLHPTGTWARRRATVPRACPWAPQALQNGSSNPIGIRHSITARSAVRCWPTAVSPRASSPRKVVRSGPVKVVSGTSRSLVTVV